VRWFIILASLVSTLGCTVHEVEDRKPPMDVPKAFSATGTGPLPDRWWTALGDGNLDALVAGALTGNLSLRSTWARLAQARAIAWRAGAASLPSLEASGGASGSASGTVDHHGNDASSGSVPFSLGLAASYELDLWGRVRSGEQAANLDLLASEQDVHAAAMTLAAGVAVSWLRILDARGQLAVLDDQAATSRAYLDAVSLRFRAGRAPVADVLQQRQALEAIQGERVRLQSALRVEEHRLAVLLGKSPVAFKAPQGRTLPSLAPLPGTGAPLAWMTRRPDLRAAYLRLQAADHRVAAAVADRFPRVSLSARTSGGWDGHTIITSWLANLAANVVAPLFDGGRRSAEVDRARAVVSERLHAWGQLLLRSLEDVENALVREARQIEYLESLEKQLALSGQAVAQARDGYKKGTTDFTRYLVATQAHQRLERTVLAARRDLILHRISLYRSLGGSWELAPPKGE
jgi:NodT family efflux transporter outer membrane factor (OMF) lipoprotein